MSAWNSSMTTTSRGGGAARSATSAHPWSASSRSRRVISARTETRARKASPESKSSSTLSVCGSPCRGENVAPPLKSMRTKRIVDKIDAAYPVETLKEWKRTAEKAVIDKLSTGATRVSFAELQIVCDAFADGDVDLPSTPMIAVPPQTKMDANALTDAIR